MNKLVKTIFSERRKEGEEVDHEDEERADVCQGGPEAEEARARRERVSEEHSGAVER